MKNNDRDLSELKEGEGELSSGYIIMRTSTARLRDDTDDTLPQISAYRCFNHVRKLRGREALNAQCCDTLCTAIVTNRVGVSWPEGWHSQNGSRMNVTLDSLR